MDIFPVPVAGAGTFTVTVASSESRVGAMSVGARGVSVLGGGGVDSSRLVDMVGITGGTSLLDGREYSGGPEEESPRFADGGKDVSCDPRMRPRELASGGDM